MAFNVNYMKSLETRGNAGSPMKLKNIQGNQININWYYEQSMEAHRKSQEAT